MHMLLILLALCLRRPNGISHLFSIAYAFAGNGCHNLNTFFDTLEDADRGKLGHKQELLEKGMHERFGKMFKERMEGYPDWWKVYDKDGNRIFKMSLMDKALLAKWREFDNRPPKEKLALLKEWAETNIPKE